MSDEEPITKLEEEQPANAEEDEGESPENEEDENDQKSENGEEEPATNEEEPPENENEDEQQSTTADDAPSAPTTPSAVAAPPVQPSPMVPHAQQPAYHNAVPIQPYYTPYPYGPFPGMHPFPSGAASPANSPAGNINKAFYTDLSVVADPLPDTRRNRGGVTEPFPEKLHRMLDVVEREGDADVVSFFSHGRAFAIHKPRRFQSDIMPRFFRQTRLTSFQRQLNLYGFQRISSGPDHGGYYHELFLKGRPGLCVNMKRTKIKGGNKQNKLNYDSEPNFYNMPPVINAGPTILAPAGGTAMSQSQPAAGAQQPTAGAAGMSQQSGQPYMFPYPTPPGSYMVVPMGPPPIVPPNGQGQPPFSSSGGGARPAAGQPQQEQQQQQQGGPPPAPHMYAYPPPPFYGYPPPWGGMMPQHPPQAQQQPQQGSYTSSAPPTPGATSQAPPPPPGAASTSIADTNSKTTTGVSPAKSPQVSGSHAV